MKEALQNVIENWGLSLRNSLRYLKEKKMHLLILGLLILINFAVIAVGFVVLYYIQGQANLSVSDTLWDSFKIIFDPASVLALKMTAVVRVIVGILVLIGIITFTGGAIGYITNLITDSIENSRKGKGRVFFKYATLFLNWNDSAMDILYDLVCDKKRNLDDEYIIVVSEEDKLLLEDEIRKKLKAFRNSYPISECNKNDPRVIVRSGDPKSAFELENVSWDSCTQVFIFQPRNTENSDYQVLKTFFSLANVIGFKKHLNEPDEQIDEEDLWPFPVVVETMSERTDDAIANYDLGNDGDNEYITRTINTNFELGKIFGQILLMPEITTAFRQMLSKSGTTITDIPLEDDAALFEKEMEELEFTIPLYEYDDEEIKNRVYLTSYMNEIIENKACDPAEESSNKTVEFSKYKYSPDFKFDTHTILIAGINRKLEYILDSLVTHNNLVKENSVNVILIETKEYEKDAKEYIENEEYRDLFGKTSLVTVDSWYDIEDYKDFIGKDFHSMFVLSLDESDSTKVDQNVFETWLALSGEAKSDSVLADTIRNKVILEIKDSYNSKLFENLQDANIVVSNEFVSLFMRQMTEGISMYDVIIDMITYKNDPMAEEQIVNKCDLLTMRAGKLFGAEETRTYKSKREFILSVYRGTKKKVIPIGIVLDETTYLFTNGKNADKKFLKKEFDLPVPSLSNDVLITENGEAYSNDERVLKIQAEDTLILAVIS